MQNPTLTRSLCSSCAWKDLLAAALVTVCWVGPRRCTHPTNRDRRDGSPRQGILCLKAEREVQHKSILFITLLTNPLHSRSRHATNSMHNGSISTSAHAAKALPSHPASLRFYNPPAAEEAAQSPPDPSPPLPEVSFVHRLAAERQQNGRQAVRRPQQKSLFDYVQEPDEAPRTAARIPVTPPESPPEYIPPVPFASGEKAKARDVLAAIRTLKTVEHEHRPATPEERRILALFCGFGPLALSIFPDPVTGRFKDGWQSTGEELKSLLTPEEYDSAKRTTFNAFYTSPTVIDAMHQAISRLGVSPGSIILEPGAGSGRFIRPDYRFIGVELDSISGRIARLLHPQAEIRIENFRDSKLPPLDAVIGNPPFADLKLDLHGQKFSLHDYFAGTP